MRDLRVQNAGELEVDGVFPGFKILVVVDVSLPPEGRLVVENFAPLVEGGVGGAPEDTAGMVFFWGLIRRKVGVVFVQSFAIIVPVDRHGEGVGDE